MKDITITSKRLKKELYILVACFVIASIINLIAIVVYKTPWYELFTQVGYVGVITILLYVILLLIRGVVAVVGRLMKKDYTGEKHSV